MKNSKSQVHEDKGTQKRIDIKNTIFSHIILKLEKKLKWELLSQSEGQK